MFPRAKHVLEAYNEQGVFSVKKYFQQEGMVIDPSTWSGRINKLLNTGHELTAALEIELMLAEFKLTKNGKENDKKTEDTGE